MSDVAAIRRPMCDGSHQEIVAGIARPPVSARTMSERVVFGRNAGV